MTVSKKAQRRPYATQKYVRTIVEKGNTRYKLSVRRADTDWDLFNHKMCELVDSCKDPVYRARLERLHKKVDQALEPVL
jgi:hypothetical protein